MADIRKHLTRIAKPTWSKTISVAVCLCAYALIELRTPRAIVPAVDESTVVANEFPAVASEAPVVASEAKQTPPIVNQPIPLQPLPYDLIDNSASDQAESQRLARKLDLPIKIAKKVSRPKQKVASPEKPLLIEPDLNFDIAEQIAAVDASDPIQEIAVTAFSEASLSEDLGTDWKVSAAQEDIELLTDPRLAPEFPVKMFMGVYKQDSFSELRNSLAEFRRELSSQRIADAPVERDYGIAPEPTLKAVSKIASLESKLLSATSATQTDSSPPEEVIDLRREELESEAEPEPVAAPFALPETESVMEAKNSVGQEPELVRPASKPVVQTPEPVLFDPKKETPVSTVLATPVIVAATVAKVASILPSVATQVVNTPVATHTATPNLPSPRLPETSTPTKPVTVATYSLQKSHRATEGPEYDALNGETIEGKLSLDDGLIRWFQDEADGKTAHIELQLEPVDRPDRQMRDTRTLTPTEYKFGDSHFRIDGRKLFGRYRLVARFYGQSLKPISEITYVSRADLGVNEFTPVSNQTSKIYFPLHRNDFESRRQDQYKVAKRNVATGFTLFEGLIGSIHKIEGARVDVVGFPNLKIPPSDKEGNIKFPMALPTNSQFILEFSHPEFYKTRTIFSTSRQEVEHDLIYPIRRKTVEEDITKLFLHGEQKPGRGLVLGMVYDPDRQHAPAKGVKFELSYEKQGAVYFDALPLRWLMATTSRGLFGFFDVVPSFRALTRPEQKDRQAMVFEVMPDTVIYPQLGRYGMRDVPVKFVDSLDKNIPVPGRAHLVADRKQYNTNEFGKTVIPNIDFPAGVITIQVEPEGKRTSGYRPTWYTVPFDPIQPPVERTLPLLKEAMIEQTIADLSHRIKVDPKKGMVFGEESSLFKNSACKYEATEALQRDCEQMSGWVKLQLHNSRGEAVEGAGPFPWGNSLNTASEPYMLSAAHPQFAFFNLKDGDYILKYLAPRKDRNGKWAYRLQRSEVFRAGIDIPSMIVH